MQYSFGFDIRDTDSRRRRANVKSTVLASCPQCRPEAVEKSAASGTNCRSVAVFQNHEAIILPKHDPAKWEPVFRKDHA
jgi:hypothetical protein